MANRRGFLKDSAVAAAWLAANQRGFATCVPGIPAALARKVAYDAQRPRYHFLPPANWMNDPNGPIFWNGHYHLFYQYNPHGAYWGDMHWGHARSRDLVHWTHLPVALAPTPGGPDKDGCFSGSAFDHNGTPTLVYTGVEPEVQCLASGDNSLIRWKKFAANPVISRPPGELQATGFRDPSIWREDGTWLMSVGSGAKGQGGSVLLYESHDQVHWSYVHKLASGPSFEARSPVESGPKYDPVETGDMWECPDFFPLETGHGLLVSTQNQVHYTLGEYSNRLFQARIHGKADYGNLYYAAKSFADPRGRRILWGWIREGRGEAAQRAAGWSGVMSLPRVLSLASDHSLRMDPAPELQVLREPLDSIQNFAVKSHTALPEMHGECLDLEAEIMPGNSQEFGFYIRQSTDRDEETELTFNAAAQRLTLDTRRSSLDPEAARAVYSAPLDLQPAQTLQISIFLDHSVVEIFANRKICLTGRIYPTRHDSSGVSIFAKGGKATVKKLNAYSMKNIW